MDFAAVVFDFRGTIVTTLTERAWVRTALSALGRDGGPGAVADVLARVWAADGQEHRLDAPGVDCDADLHRRTYLSVFADAGLDDDLAASLYAVEGDLRHNEFADDVGTTLRQLHDADVAVGVLSDIHVDVRPAFEQAGLAGLVDVFTLSFEQGVQKPDPRVFTRTLGALGAGADETLMVGDRSGPDGAAVEQGITTLLLPPLRSARERRLHRVTALVLPGGG